MLAQNKSLIAAELIQGTGAAISIKEVPTFRRQALEVWFDDLEQKHGPIVTIKPHGLKSHSVELRFGPFSGTTINQIVAAPDEDVQLARALVRSISPQAMIEVEGQDLEDWCVSDGSFRIVALLRHKVSSDAEEFIVSTCREVVVPLMAAMAELIGYDEVAETDDSASLAMEGKVSYHTVVRRERNRGTAYYVFAYRDIAAKSVVWTPVAGMGKRSAASLKCTTFILCLSLKKSACMIPPMILSQSAPTAIQQFIQGNHFQYPLTNSDKWLDSAMTELADLPTSFVALNASLPEGFRTRERVLSPCMFIERVGKKLTAKLAGVRRMGGEKKFLLAPSNAHSWVVDGRMVFPLPGDAANEFLNLMSSENPENLSYAFVLGLLSSSAGDIEVHVEPSVMNSGATIAEAYLTNLEIEGLNANLYPYQARGIQWLWDTINSSSGAILADEMGLGKTLQVIALLVMEPPPHDQPALIICPTSLITNWVRELDKFAPALTVDVHRGPNRTGVYRGLQLANVVITTYDTMVNDITIFSAFEWSWVICDEAQALKNPESNRRKCAARIPRKRSLPMTGTPVENSLLDLWSLMDFAIPGLLGDQSTFAQIYPDSTASASKLNGVVDPVILKRRVAEVADDLPERIDIDVPIDMSDNLRAFYLRVRDETIDRYPVAGALVATLQLQLVCAHPWLVSDDVSPTDPDDAEIFETAGASLNNEKIDVIVALMREAFLTNKKVLVFAIFNRLGDLIRRAGFDLPEAYWNAINGSTPQSDRQSIIDEFTDHEGPGCLVLNPKAAGAGLNITAATVVIHTSPVWNPALEAQASARAHRRGQDMPVTVYRLFYEGTVERVMLDRSIWRNEMGNEIAPVSTRDADDLKRAFEIEPASS